MSEDRKGGWVRKILLDLRGRLPTRAIDCLEFGGVYNLFIDEVAFILEREDTAGKIAGMFESIMWVRQSHPSSKSDDLYDAWSNLKREIEKSGRRV